LNIGASYDWYLTSKDYRLTAVGNFTSNSFSRDLLGGGLEFGYRDLFALRVGYKSETDFSDLESSLDNGISAGFSVSVPLRKKEAEDVYIPRMSIDYGYRSTDVFNGIHNIGVRIDL
jgi:hypothetical protein